MADDVNGGTIADVPFEDTQIGPDGRRHPTSKVQAEVKKATPSEPSVPTGQVAVDEAPADEEPKAEPKAQASRRSSSGDK